MKVRKGKIPYSSLVNKYLPVNYSDVYTCEVTDDKNLSPDDILVSFWTKQPKWIESLFKLRNTLVKPFGLKGDEANAGQDFEKSIREGTNYNMLSVPEKSPEETVICLSDKHLSAYLSVHMEKLKDGNKRISLITLVRFQNWLGPVYFYAIYPFHHLVVRMMLSSTLKRLLI